MNNDNEFTCSHFNEHLRAYIDDELPVNIRSSFLAHSSVCEGCSNELHAMQHTRKLLASLHRITVSPEFGFKMKMRISREQEYLQKQWYSLKLMVQDNLSRFIAVPAAAVLVLAALAFYHAYMPGRMDSELPAEVEQQIRSGQGVELVQERNDFYSEEVNYVLEKVTPQDIEQGVIMSGPRGPGDSATGNQEIILISF